MVLVGDGGVGRLVSRPCPSTRPCREFSVLPTRRRPPAAPPSTASAPPRSPRPPSSRHARTSRARSGSPPGEVQPVALALHSHDGVGPPMQELQLRRARLEGEEAEGGGERGAAVRRSP